MKSFLNYFYHLDLRQNECNPPTKSSEKEDNLYEKLQALLTKEEFINRFGPIKDDGY